MKVSFIFKFIYKKIKKSIVFLYFFIFYILLIPLQITYRLIQIFTNAKKGLLIINPPNIGDVLYIAKYMNNISEEVYVAVSKKLINIIRIMVDNSNLTIINIDELNIRFIWNHKISRIINTPFSSIARSIKIYLLPWRISYIIRNPFGISHKSIIEWIHCLVIFWEQIFYITRNLSFFTMYKENADTLAQKYLSKKFKMNRKHSLINKKQKTKNNILINMYGSKKYRQFPILLIELLFDISDVKNTEITFIGIRKEEIILVNKIIRKYPKHNINNLIYKTKIDDLIPLVKNAKLIISAETSIVHLANIFNTYCITWLDYWDNFAFHSTWNWQLVNVKFWSWKKKKNVFYVNTYDDLIKLAITKTKIVNASHKERFIGEINSILRYK